MFNTLEIKRELNKNKYNNLIVKFNCPKSVNTFNNEVLTEINKVIDIVESENISGLIFTSSKDGCFVNGADLNEMRDMDEKSITRFIEKGQNVFNRIENLNNVITVAAINGHAMGGGLEIALACDYRIVSDIGLINIGLPESKLGILPAWGGTTRLTHLLGLSKALPLLLSGKLMSPRKALKTGIVDKVVRPESLMHAARRFLNKDKPDRGLKGIDYHLTYNSFLRNIVLKSAAKKTYKQSRGNYPALPAIIGVAKKAIVKGPTEGFHAEKDMVSKLAITSTCENLMRIFFLKNKAKKAWKQELSAKPNNIKYAAVIGGGTMGAGIAAALIKSGIKVRLIEVDSKAASAAISRVKKDIDFLVKSKEITKLQAEMTMNLLSVSTDWSGLKLADIAIEAVAENLDVKHEIFKKLDENTKPEAILATNTSSISLNDISEAVDDPSRVIGLHFFNPVSKMPLVEVVRSKESNDLAIATGANLSFKMGKVGIIVNDGPGFLVNRLLIPYLVEALLMLTDGYDDIERIDKEMLDWGMPMGPFTLMDQIGLDIVVSIFKSLLEKTKLPIRNKDGSLHNSISAFIKGVEKSGFKGKKSGKGFYIYKKNKKKVNTFFIDMICNVIGNLTRYPGFKKDKNIDWIEMRLLIPMIHEMTRTVEEGIISDFDMIDLATVLGLGLAPFRGGLAQFSKDLGPKSISDWSRKLSNRCNNGLRFRAPTINIENNNNCCEGALK